MSSVLGTSYYVAPEVLQKNYTKSCDLWGVGVITYMLLSGIAPFGGNTDAEILQKVRQACYDFPDKHFKSVSEEGKDFIRGLLKKDPKARFTAEQALQHAWIQKLHREFLVRARSRRLRSAQDGDSDA